MIQQLSKDDSEPVMNRDRSVSIGTVIVLNRLHFNLLFAQCYLLCM